MACFKPMTAWFGTGYSVDTGKPKMVFQIEKANDPSKPFFLPCGKCIGCRLSRSAEWADKIYFESMSHERSCFATFTYGDGELPPLGSLCKPDIQKLNKRLRFDGLKFRYVYTGEYGDKFGRPHYHAILFGQDFSEDRVLDGLTPSGFNQYISPYLEDKWGKGRVRISDLDRGNALYMAGYAIKKIGGDEADDHYYGREREFLIASNRPGIGSDEYRKHRDFYCDNGTIHVPSKSGLRLRPVPKSFYNIEKRERPEIYECVSEVRREEAIEASLSPDNSPDRLRAREDCAIAKSRGSSHSLHVSDSDPFENVSDAQLEYLHKLRHEAFLKREAVIEQRSAERAARKASSRSLSPAEQARVASAARFCYSDYHDAENE